MVLGMTWRLAIELTKTNDVVERNGWCSQPFIFGIDSTRSSEMERGPKQHRSMSIREYEAIAVGPDRIFRIKSQHPIPDRIHQRRQCHRCTGVSRLGLLYGIDRKSANS